MLQLPEVWPRDQDLQVQCPGLQVLRRKTCIHSVQGQQNSHTKVCQLRTGAFQHQSALPKETGSQEQSKDFVHTAPNDTAYKRWSCHSDSSCCTKCVEPPRPQQWGGPIYLFLGMPAMWTPAGWLALLLTKAGDVEANPGPTTLNKKVWICDFCHKQIHVRKHKVQQD